MQHYTGTCQCGAIVFSAGSQVAQSIIMSCPTCADHDFRPASSCGDGSSIISVRLEKVALGHAFPQAGLLADVGRFQYYEDILRADYPGAIAEAAGLGDNLLIAGIASPDQAWEALWGKPLYANARVTVADTWIQKLRPLMANALAAWGDGGTFKMERVATGRSNDAFRGSGSGADEIFGAGVARYRIFAIYNATMALKKRTLNSFVPFADLEQLELATAVSRLSKEFGEYWGPVTVMHFMADLGLCIKPDIHLVRTIRHLSGLPVYDSYVASLEEAVGIDHAVRDLAARLPEPVTPQRVRYLDKILMEISRQGLFP